MTEIEEQALRLAPANTYTSSDITALWATIDELRAGTLALQPTMKAMLFAARIDAALDVCKAAEKIAHAVLPLDHAVLMIERLQKLAAGLAAELRGGS